MKNFTYYAFIKNADQKLRLLLLLLMLTMSYLPLSAQQPNSFVLAIPGQNLNFLNTNRTLITNAGNNGLSAGSVWRYDNLITTNGITIYGILTIKELNGTTITELDNETVGLPGRFQPFVTTNTAGGFALFELEFYEVVTNNRAYISEYYFTSVDIDASEFVEIGGYSTYQVDSSSGLTISQQPSGRTRFGGITGDLTNVTFENTAAFIAQYKFPYTKVTFALGKSNTGTSRQYSVQFGTAGGTFTNPTSVRNPVKLMYINKTADSNYFVGGTTRKYTVVLDNLGSTSENVTLTDPLPAGLTYVPNSTTISVPAASVNENVADNFNSVSYARNNGTALWKNEWAEIGETTDPATGQISITGNRLNFVTLPAGRGIERTANLTRAKNATLSFAYTQSATGGTLDVQVSPNGSNYFSIGTITGTANGTFSAPISDSYLTGDTRIRLVNSGTAWATRTVTVDDILLQYTLSELAQNKTNALSGGTLLNGVPPNVIVSGDNITLLPGAQATITFDVTVNCNAQGTITNTATAATPGLYEDTISSSHTAYVDPVNVTGGSRCQAGTVILTATGAQGNQQYRWYAAPSGGSPLATGSSFTTPSISGTTTYYVSFYNPNSGCETGRTPVTATVSSASSFTGTGVISSTTGQNGSVLNTVAQNGISAANSGTGVAWTNPGNAVNADTNRATVTLSSTNTLSQNLDILFPNLTSAIPALSTITGIQIGILRSGTSTIRDNTVQLLRNGTLTGTNLANTGTNWATTETTTNYGGNNILWGATWTPADFANAGLRIRAAYNSGTAPIASVNNVTITVFYSTFGDDQSSVSFTINGISGATGYTWTVPTGATITSGQGTASILVNFNNAGQNGSNYNVCATPTNTCSTGTQVCRTLAISDNVNNEISGTVYNDQNGSVSPQKVDGVPISQIAGQQLYAILTRSATTGTPPVNRAISSVTIAPDGTYRFSYLPNTTANYYRVYIKTTPFGDNIEVPANPDLPAGAAFNGEIDNNDTNSLLGRTSTLGYLDVTAGNNTNNTNVNFGILVNNPVANSDTANTLEDNSVTFNILSNDTVPTGSINSTSVDLDPSTPGRQISITTANGSWNVDNSGNVTFTPVADYFGTDSILYTVASNGGFISNPTSITVTVIPVNDAPSFTKGSDQTHIQTGSAVTYTVSGWATNISKGPANESVQNISFIVNNTNNAMFSVQPVINTNGQLQYTVAANASGVATVSVRIQDDGGTANGGIDTSPIQTFTITVNTSRCYKPAVTNTTNTIPTLHGITAFSRAGANNDNWPMVKQSAWTVLESKEKGFVINRIPTSAAVNSITNPVIGMMVYDAEAKCLKIYALKEGETAATWYCFETQACPD